MSGVAMQDDAGSASPNGNGAAAGAGASAGRGGPQVASSSGPSEVELVIDAMPYIDWELNDPAVKEQVDALVAEEAARSTLTPADYLVRKNLPLPELKLVDSLIWASESARIADGKAQTPLDVTRYKVEAPKLPFLLDAAGRQRPEVDLTAAQREEALNAWTAAVRNAQAQLAHQTQRLVNLELMKRYGGAAWKQHTEQLQRTAEGVESANALTRRAIDAVNKKRKTEQMQTAAPALHALEGQWHELTRKNNEIEAACHVLQSDIKRLKTIAGAKGLLPPAAAQGASDAAAPARPAAAAAASK